MWVTKELEKGYQMLCSPTIVHVWFFLLNSCFLCRWFTENGCDSKLKARLLVQSCQCKKFWQSKIGSDQQMNGNDFSKFWNRDLNITTGVWEIFLCLLRNLLILTLPKSDVWKLRVKSNNLFSLTSNIKLASHGVSFLINVSNSLKE